jgi:hypothetical protein
MTLKKLYSSNTCFSETEKTKLSACIRRVNNWWRRMDCKYVVLWMFHKNKIQFITQINLQVREHWSLLKSLEKHGCIFRSSDYKPSLISVAATKAAGKKPLKLIVRVDQLGNRLMLALLNYYYDLYPNSSMICYEARRI